MSASAAPRSPSLPRRWRPSPDGRSAVRAFEWAVSVPVLAALAAWLGTGPDLRPVLPWVPMVVAASLMAVPQWRTVSMDMSLPVLLAAGMALGPGRAALLALVVSFDVREWRREIAPGRAVFNRCQVALSTAAAAWAYHALRLGPDDAYLSLPAFGPALLADLVVNAAMVVALTRLSTGLGWWTILRGVLGDRPAEYVLTYLCLGSLALAISPLVQVVGTVGAVVGLAPPALAWRAFLQARRLREASHAIDAKNRALVAVTARIAEERRDERLSIAGDLHDEVLQPLYHVHLMGEVLRRDLAAGRLLDLEDDLPRLLDATRAAQDALRRVVRDLRASSLGPGGLPVALAMLVRTLEGTCAARIELDVGETRATPLSQLLAYQIVREALQNAVKHASARRIGIRVREEGGAIRATVEDDGVGFDPSDASRQDHFGLALMRERAEAVGGHVLVESRPGEGTRVVASLPARTHPGG